MGHGLKFVKNNVDMQYFLVYTSTMAHKKGIPSESKEEKLKANKAYYKRNPWAKTMQRIRHRCHPERGYGKRGIKCFLTMAQVKFLWFRDKAFLLKKPSIDRKNGGNYILRNCRFIELKENQKRSRNYGQGKNKTV